MTIEAPLSKYKRNNFLIYIVACIAGALWFGYDGYLNQKFIKDHTDEQGRPDSTLIINQKTPPFLFAGALLFGGYLFAIRGRKVVAAEDALIVSSGKKILYDAIEQIDKTHFKKRGFFTITYKNDTGGISRHTLSDRQYGNLEAILNHLVAQIS